MNESLQLNRAIVFSLAVLTRLARGLMRSSGSNHSTKEKTCRNPMSLKETLSLSASLSVAEGGSSVPA